MFSIKKVAGISVALGLVVAGTVSVPADARSKVAPKILTIWADSDRSENLTKAIGTLAQQSAGEYVSGYKINVVGYSGFDALKTAMDSATSANGPDIILGANDWVPAFAKDGKLAQFTLSSSAAKQFSANQLGDLSYNGKLYGVPLDINNVAMLTNDDLTTVPTSFGAMVDYYKANKVSEGLTRGLCVAGGGMSWGAAGVLSALGGAPYAMKSGKAAITGAPFTVKTFADNVKAQLLNADGSPNGFFTNSDANCKQDFIDGKVPFAVIGNWEWKDYIAEGFDMNKLSCVPGIKVGSCGAGFGSVSGALLTSFAGSDENAAKSFLNDFFGSASGAMSYVKYEQRPPANKAAAAVASPALKGFGLAASKASIPQLGTFLNGGAKDTTGLVLSTTKDAKGKYIPGTKGANIPNYWDALPALWTALVSSDIAERKDPLVASQLFANIMAANAANSVNN
jgi:arabinogalactan oligomer/maltooligosaccharide transport system substrate-binding protein